MCIRDSLLNLDEVRHLCDFLDFPEKLTNALATCERLRHAFLSPRRTAGTGTTLRKAAIHRDHQDRRRARAVHVCMIRPDTESVNRNRRPAVYGAIPGCPEITVLCRPGSSPRPGTSVLGTQSPARNPLWQIKPPLHATWLGTRNLSYLSLARRQPVGRKPRLPRAIPGLRFASPRGFR